MARADRTRGAPSRGNIECCGVGAATGDFSLAGGDRQDLGADQTGDSWARRREPSDGEASLEAEARRTPDCPSDPWFFEAMGRNSLIRPNTEGTTGSHPAHTRSSG